MLFDDFLEHQVLGRSEYYISRELVEQWCDLYGRALDPSGADRIPLGFVPVIKMCAYMDACPIRPPGNIHGGQSYDIRALPKIGETVITEVECAHKEIRKGRRWVHFQTRTSGRESGQDYASGEMKIVWAK